MRRVSQLFIIGAAALLLAPTSARAEGFVSPWASVNFGDAGIESRGAFGVTGGYMGAGVIGGEVDFGWAPDMFSETFDNSLLTLMGNLIVGVPLGGTEGVGVRPYGTAGLGLMRQHFDADAGLPELNQNDLGFNVGAGLMGFFNDHVGMRGDLRYFRTIDTEDTGDGVNVDLGGFDFWRASIGVVIR